MAVVHRRQRSSHQASVRRCAIEFIIGNLKAGVGEHTARVSLPDAFIQKESRNVRRQCGVYKKVRGRLPALCDADGLPIACPTGIYAVTAVDRAGKKFTIGGNHASDIVAPVRINGSTGNDGLYTLVSATDAGGNTEIVVAEAIDDATVDGNVFAGLAPVLRYHLHVKEGSNVEYLLVGTAYHILLWSQVDHVLKVKFTCTSPTDVTSWSMVSFQDQVYATNGSDYVQVWDVHTSVALNFTNVGGVNGIEYTAGTYLTAAKFVCAYEAYLILGCTFENGAWCRKRNRWCDEDDPTEWNEDNAGDQGCHDLMDEEGFVNGYARWSTYLIIGGTKRMIRVSIVATDVVFQWERTPICLGCLAPDSMVNDKLGRLYFLASDLTLRELDSAQSIYRTIEETIKNINPVAAADARSFYYEDLDRIFWSVPTGTSTTNDLVIEYAPEDGDFYYRNMAISAFGSYTHTTAYTYDTLPYSTYDEWGAAWGTYDSNLNTTGPLIPLAADFDGYSYELGQSDTDNGETLTGSLVFGSSFGGNLRMFKRISEPATFIFNRQPTGSTVTISAKGDTAQEWESLGDFSLVDSSDPETVWVDVPMDVRARYHAFKIESEDYYEFVAATFEVEEDGVR